VTGRSATLSLMNRARTIRFSSACWARSCLCLAAMPFFANLTLSQPEPGTPPPLHLPRFIWECEAGAGASSSTCSVWIWHGSSYTATWSIGAAGKLTVEGTDPSQLTVRREDDSGSLAGLTATYIAKWDGTRFADGKMSFTFKGSANTGVWSAVPLVTPVVHTLFGTVQTITQDELYGVGRRPAPYYNWYSADLTAYAIHADRFAGSANSTAIDDFRVRGELPMKPGDRREMSLRAHLLRPDYEGGAAYRPGMAIAAIYADGTTFGDRKVLSAMIDYRRSMLTALGGIASTMCTLGARHSSSLAELDAALNQQHTADDGRSPADKEARAAAYASVDKSLHRGTARLSDSQIVKRSWDALDKLRSGLADPVKTPSGQAAISYATQLTCDLP
jgi:hypothetical protein